jgi:hypothetical protein
MNFLFVSKSSNVKTGPIPVTGSPSLTCPDSCELKKTNTCYANFGPIAWHWSRIDRNAIGVSFNELLEKVKALPIGTFFRHNQFGDLFGVNEMINLAMLSRFVNASLGKSGFTYTHKPVLGNSENVKRNRKAIKEANKKGFTINLSADSLEEADSKKALNIGPVTVVLSTDAPEKLFTPKGNKVIVCPAQTKDTVTCSTCKLCSRSNRSVIIGFRAHGIRKGAIDKRIANNVKA